jgi:hypothetical protein
LDIATLTNAPREVVLAGLPYKVAALTLRDWGELHQFLKQHADDPVTTTLRQVARARAASVPVSAEQEQFLLREARAEARGWPPRVASQAWFEALSECEGGDDQFLLATLRACQPSITIEQARELGGKLSGEESLALMFAAVGVEPPPKPTLDGEATPTEATTTPSSVTTGAGPSTP